MATSSDIAYQKSAKSSEHERPNLDILGKTRRLVVVSVLFCKEN